MKSVFGLFDSEQRLRSLAEKTSFLDETLQVMGSSIRVPEFVPSPTEDCERLKKAFDGLGTDEDVVIWILGHRTASQRRQIKDTYQQLYKESLIARLDSELSGDFARAVILWTYDPAERDAKLASEALMKTKKKGVKHLKTIVEIACASSPHHLMTVRQAYCSLFDSSLEEEILSSVSPSLSKLLVGLVSSYRYDKQIVDSVVASSEAARLHEAIKQKQLDHEDVLCILCTRNFFQLKATFQCYKQKYGSPLDQDIQSFGDGDFESLLNETIRCIESPEDHFAKVIRESIVGLGTDEDSLTRAIVTRAEIDLRNIREQYAVIYKSSLNDDVKDDTSGDYKNFLMTLLGARL